MLSTYKPVSPRPSMALPLVLRRVAAYKSGSFSEKRPYSLYLRLLGVSRLDCAHVLNSCHHARQWCFIRQYIHCSSTLCVCISVIKFILTPQSLPPRIPSYPSAVPFRHPLKRWGRLMARVPPALLTAEASGCKHWRRCRLRTASGNEGGRRWRHYQRATPALLVPPQPANPVCPFIGLEAEGRAASEGPGSYLASYTLHFHLLRWLACLLLPSPLGCW